MAREINQKFLKVDFELHFFDSKTLKIEIYLFPNFLIKPMIIIQNSSLNLKTNLIYDVVFSEL